MKGDDNQNSLLLKDFVEHRNFSDETENILSKQIWLFTLHGSTALLNAGFNSNEF